jgi:hypothetical protein
VIAFAAGSNVPFWPVAGPARTACDLCATFRLLGAQVRLLIWRPSAAVHSDCTGAGSAVVVVGRSAAWLRQGDRPPGVGSFHLLPADESDHVSLTDGRRAPIPVNARICLRKWAAHSSTQPKNQRRYVRRSVTLIECRRQRVERFCRSPRNWSIRALCQCGAVPI